MVLDRGCVGITNEAIAVRATTITIPGDANPALTAACPNTTAPTILMVCPKVWGRRKPASRSTSNDNSIIRASTRPGKGTPSLVTSMVISSSVGSSSW